MGPKVEPGGVRFRVDSVHAASVHVGLFAGLDSAEPERVIELKASAPAGEPQRYFEGVAAGAAAGAFYALRVDGPWDPSAGHRFRSEDWLLDPRALAVDGPTGWRDRFHATPADPTLFPKAIVTSAEPFDWGKDRPPRIPWRDTVVYEAHVAGLTRAMQEVPPEQRGTYAALGSEPLIAYLRSLGITALELLPVAASVSEPHLVTLGKSNVWGYSPVAFFAPDARFATAPVDGGDPRPAGLRAIDELRGAVRALHSADIEVWLDVVFNHTGEGPPEWRPISLRGIDHASYHRLDPEDPSRGIDWTGCGNTIDTSREPGRALVLDALRHWVTEMHVDGFRFDLAATLARNPSRPDALAPLIADMDDDPVLGSVKRIAEPWDLGPHGSFEGRFPSDWREWNGRFRDTVRRFWRGDPSSAGDFATRIAGSSDLYREPRGVSFVCAHDGMTLRDLTSYAGKRNDENGESSRDGAADDLGSAWGDEGPAEGDEETRSRRARIRRGLLATVMLSAGVPQILWGDEAGRTQRGNNNGYALDDERLDLPTGPRADTELLEFFRHLARVRASCPHLRTDRLFEPNELTWLREDGAPMTTEDWHDPERRALTARYEVDGATVLLLVNAQDSERTFTLPEGEWLCRVDTAKPATRDEHVEAADRVLAGGTLVLLTRPGTDR